MQDMMNQMMGISGSKKEKKGDKSATCLLEAGSKDSKVVLRPLFVQASSLKHLSIEPAVSRFTLRGPYV